MKERKEYEKPSITAIYLSDTDILTESVGFGQSWDSGLWGNPDDDLTDDDLTEDW